MIQYNNTKEYLRGLINLAYMHVGLPLLLFAWIYLESTSGQLSGYLGKVMSLVVFFFCLLITFVSVYIGQQYFNRSIKLAKQQTTLREKLAVYRQAVSTKFFSFSIPSLLVAIGLFLTDNDLFAILFAILIVLFSINNPSARKIAKELGLKDPEREIVLKGIDFPEQGAYGSS